MEIGLNGGHSAENFLRACPDVQKFVSFDLNSHPYVAVAVDFFQQKYQNRFVFVPGDSQITVPKYKTEFPTETFDLIYIDGGHDYGVCLNDIINAYHLANPNTILWMDDYYAGVFQAIQECVQRGILEVLQIHPSTDPCGDRCWIEARFLF